MTTHPITPIKYPREPPGPVLKRLDIHDLYEQQIARHGALNLKGAREVMDLGQVDVLDIVGAVIVLDLAAGPERVNLSTSPEPSQKWCPTNPGTQF
jgi:hypothetical protein